MKRRRLYDDGFDCMRLGSPNESDPQIDPLVDVRDDLYERFCRALEELADVDDLIRQRYSAALFEWERGRAAAHTAGLSPSREQQSEGRHLGL